MKNNGKRLSTKIGSKSQKQLPQKTLSGYPITEDMRKVQADFDALFESVFEGDTERIKVLAYEPADNQNQ